jgi:hypothetical protein
MREAMLKPTTEEQPTADCHEQVWVIAKREFLVTVTRKGLHLRRSWYAVAFWRHLWHQLSHERHLEQSSKSGSEPIAVVDRSHTVDFELTAALSRCANLRLRPLKFSRRLQEQAVQDRTLYGHDPAIRT